MEIFNLFLHLDESLNNIIILFGPLTYLILFAIIFAETGLVVAPFLPGDSLLFIAGTLAAGELLNIWILYASLLAAAILGDSLNYWLGHHFGAKVFTRDNSRIFNKAYLEKTREFYEKHGGKAIIIARFVPIVRTFAPFVAGIGKMHYKTFISYNIIGAFIWVTGLIFAGYYFGTLPIVSENFETAVLTIILLSLIPPALEIIRHRHEQRRLENTSYDDIKATFRKEHLND